MVDRRTFLKTAAVAGSAALLDPVRALGTRYQDSTGFFGVHPFIENNPEAVFIMRTSVDVKTNSEAKKQAGLNFGRSVLVPKEEGEGGIPLTHKVALKPNLTCRYSWHDKYTVEGTMGIVTDAYLVEGMIQSMKELGIAGTQFYIREVNCPEDFDDSGYWGLAERTGADFRDMSPEVGVISENDLVWVDVPDGMYFRKIPYLWPINAPDTFLLNIAKLKAHGMGITLCSKNLQGTIAHNYQQHCGGWNLDMDAAHRNINAQYEITENHRRHVADGIPRWDKPGDNGGIWQERWASRCIDNNSVTHPGLHIIDGVYSRDGNFVEGPGPNGLANDFMTNMIIFGKNHIYVDIIGHWLSGHEPGNFGLFHIAVERGAASVLNPMAIPVYEWKQDGSATLTPLTEFTRTPLLTYYLQRNYDGQNEPWWHMVDEPYDYGPLSVDEGEPEAFVLHQNRPNPFNPFTSIEYSIPQSGYARLEIYNASGQLMEVLVDGYRTKGAHMAVWNTANHSSGVYFYRFRFGGFNKTRKMLLLK